MGQGEKGKVVMYFFLNNMIYPLILQKVSISAAVDIWPEATYGRPKRMVRAMPLSNNDHTKVPESGGVRGGWAVDGRWMGGVCDMGSN